MPSANQTLPGSQSYRFLADTTLRTANLNAYGGVVINMGPDKVWIAEGQDTIKKDGSDPNSIQIPSAAPGFNVNPSTLQTVPTAGGQKFYLSRTTRKFAFCADTTTAYIVYENKES